MKKFKQILTLVLSVIALIIVFQNTESIETRLLFFKVTIPRTLLLIINLALGFIAGIIVCLTFSKKRSERKNG